MPIITVIGTSLPVNRHRTALLWRLDKPHEYEYSQRIDCREFATAPTAMLGLIDFYLRNPRARGELGTDAALARARSLAAV